MSVGSPPPPALDGRYRFVKSLPAGPKAWVWLAIDEATEQLVLASAVGKNRLASLEPALGLRSPQLAALLDVVHEPNPAQIPGSSRVQAAAVVLAEYVPGGTLHDQVRLRRLAPADAVTWLARLSEGVALLHERGAAHGAISPRSIVVAPESRVERPVLTQLEHAPAGPYCTAERVEGAPPSSADDVWALSATLYYALTGAAPFEGKTKAALVESLARGRPASLRSLGVADPHLEQLLERCFGAAGPRLESARELRAALGEWLQRAAEEDWGVTDSRLTGALEPGELGAQEEPPLSLGSSVIPLPGTLAPPRPATVPPPSVRPPPLPQIPAAAPSSAPPAPAPPTAAPGVAPEPPLGALAPPLAPTRWSLSDSAEEGEEAPRISSIPPLSHPPPRASLSSGPYITARVSELPESLEGPRLVAVTAPLGPDTDPTTEKLVRAPRAPAPAPPRRAPRWLAGGLALVALLGLLAWAMRAWAPHQEVPPHASGAGARPSASPATPPPELPPPTDSAALSGATPSASPAPAARPQTAPAGDPSACIARLFPPDSLGQDAELGFLCEPEDLRSLRTKLHTRLVSHGSLSGRVTAGMKEWSTLQWFQMAVVSAARQACCPAPLPTVLPETGPGCPSLAQALPDAVSPWPPPAGEISARAAKLEAAITCLYRLNMPRAYGYKERPYGANRLVFEEFLRRNLSP